MKMNIKILISVFFFIYSLYLLPQENVRDAGSFNLYNTQLKLFKSDSVDDTFHILISLPDEYNSSDKRYSVLYVLDGDVSYGIASGIARYLEIGANIPELIVIGIGYGTADKNSGNKRNRDYRPDNTGGAEKFLQFIKNELIPYVDTNYRTIAGENTLASYSLGGLFALYSLFNQPEIFNRYIIGSPYLLPENYIIFDYEEQSVATLNKANAKLFISVGSEASDEKYFTPIDELVTILQERNYPGIELETKVFDGSTHLAGPPEVITHGLISVFGE